MFDAGVDGLQETHYGHDRSFFFYRKKITNNDGMIEASHNRNVIVRV